MTETDPQLYFADDGNPRSARFDDIYYSLQDGLSETRAVFLDGCHLPEAWAGRRHFTVGELGFGTALNIAALMQRWAAHRPDKGHLHLFSVEGFLMPREAAAKALSSWPDLGPWAEAIIAQWPPQRRGVHVMDFPQWGVTLTLFLMDVREALTQWEGQADAWFLDGFSPAQNPGMWAEDVLRAVADKSAPGARLATFTVAGFVRRGLQAAGFEVFKRPGFGRKRERLEAVFPGAPESHPTLPPEPERIAVVGGGIAGASVIHALHGYGYAADLFDPQPGGGASGNPAGLVTPRLDAGGGAISALFADAFYYATALIQRLAPKAVVSGGVLQRPSSDRDAGRFAKVAAQDVFDPADLRAGPEGLHMQRALAVRPAEVTGALTGDARRVAAQVIAVAREDDQWTVVTDQGRHAGYDLVFLATGAGIFDRPEAAAFDLRPVRGQIEMATAGDRDPQAQAWGGYYVPTPDGFVFGSTHVRGDRGADVRAGDTAQNLETLRKVLPDQADQAEGRTISRAAVRVTTRDHLPVIGAVRHGLHVLTGLGSRGFCLAPLLAKAAVSAALNVPQPLTVAALHLVRIERFSGDNPSLKGPNPLA